MKRLNKQGFSIINDKDTQAFVRGLAFSDDHILEQFVLTLDGRNLTRDEAKSFIAFIRAERSSK
jgi:hypothetical protein